MPKYPKYFPYDFMDNSPNLKKSYSKSDMNWKWLISEAVCWGDLRTTADYFNTDNRFTASRFELSTTLA
jgi:hypothetical protein